MFQSAPLTEARGDRPCVAIGPNGNCFNPLPSPKQGETGGTSSSVRLLGLFQSAPLTEARGDQPHPATGSLVVLFQSAPLTEARGDLPPASAVPCRLSFNPLPSPKQGETGPVLPLDPMVTVSIRSPHRSKGRPAAPVPVSDYWACFNPLPSPKQGETSRIPRRVRSWCCFNPLPSPKQGETFPRRQQSLVG